MVQPGDANSRSSYRDKVRRRESVALEAVVMPAKKPKGDEFRGRVVSVFGPFNSKALVEVSMDTALRMIEADAIAPRSFGVIDAIDNELAGLREHAPEIADSALAAAARALAYELENPYNSLTSKSQATKELRDGMDRLRELVPDDSEEDAIDGLRADLRLVGGTGT